MSGSSSSAEKVQCPICQQWVIQRTINDHIDKGCPEPSHAAPPSPKVEEPPRVASLFLPKVTKKPSPPRELKQRPFFSQESKPPPRNPFVSQQEHPFSQETKPSVKRQAEPPVTPPVKRSKNDIILESMPLAAKVRPKSLADFVGQEELLGENGILKALIDNDRIPSMVLWGPPGCGKTTTARIISKATKSRFIELSATSHGAADVKKAFEEAKGHLSLTGQKTIVFIDEIHRFTKAQQDLFLPFVEQGTIHLIGATTENPSFKVNSALLSRCRVFVLQRLEEEHLEKILGRALQTWRGPDIIIDDTCEKEALKQLAVFSDGDARNGLNTLEIALDLLHEKSEPLKVETIKGAFQKSHLLYDRNGEEHYNIISALHKSIRGSDPDGALYWLGRMLEAGEDPLYVARRLVRCASEDIGLADNTALPLAMAAYNACEKIGMPECDTILAHLVVHLAETKKSVRSYKAYNLVKSTIRNEPGYPVPMHIRNAPTKLMKNLGYGKDYKYNPDYDEPVDQTYLPDQLKDRKFLEPRKD